MKDNYLEKKDFEWIDWKTSDIKKIPEQYLLHKEREYKKIKSIKAEERTFKNTLLALENSDGEFSEKISYLHLISNLHTDKKMREVASLAEQEIAKKSIELEYDRGIFQALRELKDRKEKLDTVSQKLFDDYLKSYERMGFLLDKKKQKEIKQLSKEISKLSLVFSKNINDYRDNIVLKKNQTQGLSENFLSILKKNEKGNYLVSLDSSEYGTFISQSENDDKRKELIIKESKAGGRKNLKILNKILDLKNKRAKILGYKNHGEYILERRMAKNPETVEKFLNSLIKKVEKAAQKDLEKILNQKKKYLKTKNKNEKIYFWETAFYSQQLKKETLDLDSEKLREYFPLEYVLKNMFEIFGSLFDISFKIKKQKLWHEEVRLVVISDRKTKKEIAYIVMDLFPREGKYGHLCVMNHRQGRKENGKRVLPITVLVCNFRKANKKIPSLLSLGDVEGLFHEFGHALHNSLGKSEYISQFGFNVVWDFVELPSQLLENWLYNEKTLKKISKHYLTDRKLSQKDIDNILKSKKFLISLHTLRQLSLGILDIILHTKGHRNPEKLYQKIYKKYFNINLPKESLFPARFGHLVGGYDAGYYSYLWALVYADDVFSKFKKNGIFNKKIGRRYRKEILEKGSERDEMESLKLFLGRKPNDKAFLRNLK